MRADLLALGRAGSWLRGAWKALRFDLVLPLRDARRALAVVGNELFAMAGELGRAEAEEIPISDAVHDAARFPHITAIHQALEDIVALTLPPELLRWAESFFADPPVELLETIDASLAHAALDERRPAAIRRLAQFWLFEGVRLNLVVTDRLAGAQNLAVCGMTSRDLDRIAAHEVGVLIELVRVGRIERPSIAHAVNAGMLHAAARARELRGMAIALGQAEHLDRVAEGEEVLNDLEAVDAILLREWADSPSGKLDPEAVRRKHAIVFGDYAPGTLSTRLTRVKDRLERDDPPPRRASLLDLIRRTRGW